MHVVTTEGDFHAVAVGHHHTFVGLAVVIAIDQLPKFWNVGVEDFVSSRQNASACAFFDTVETIGEHDAAVGDVVTIGVLNQTQAVIVLGIGDCCFAKQPFVVINAILDGLGCQVG